MARMSEREAKKILTKYPLKSHTPYSITDEKAFLLELAKIRKHGFGVDVEEFVEGVMGIAAPIWDYSRQVIAAICAGLPASRRMDEKYIDQVGGLVKKTCEEISSNLGYMKI